MGQAWVLASLVAGRWVGGQAQQPMPAGSALHCNVDGCVACRGEQRLVQPALAASGRAFNLMRHKGTVQLNARMPWGLE